jgi:hypothetical protein
MNPELASWTTGKEQKSKIGNFIRKRATTVEP